MRSGTCSLRTIPMIPSSWRNRFVRRGTAPDDGTSGVDFESSSQKQWRPGADRPRLPDAPSFPNRSVRGRCESPNPLVLTETDLDEVMAVELAQRFAAAVEETLAFLSRFPEAGRPRAVRFSDLTGYRGLNVFEPFGRFRVYYRVIGEELHAERMARRPSSGRRGRTLRFQDQGWSRHGYFTRFIMRHQPASGINQRRFSQPI